MRRGLVRLRDGVSGVDEVAVAGEVDGESGGGAELAGGVGERGGFAVLELAGGEDGDVVIDAEVGEALGERVGEAAAEGGEFGVRCVGDGGRQDGEGAGSDGGWSGCVGRGRRVAADARRYVTDAMTIAAATPAMARRRLFRMREGDVAGAAIFGGERRVGPARSGCSKS